MTKYPDHPTPPPTEERVSIVTGDRMCASCHYNLMGQPVLREAHYNLLIIRCPECATVASVQEYPLLGKWSGRWAAVLAGIWLFFLFALFAGSTGGVLGPGRGISALAPSRFFSLVQNKYYAWFTETYPDNQGVPPGVNVYAEWWDQQDIDLLFTEFGGWPAVLWPDGVYFLIPWTLAFFFGCLWSVALLHLSRQWRFLAALLYAGVWGGIVFLVVYNSTVSANSNMNAYFSGLNYFGDVVFITSTAISWGILLCGLLFGRGLIRLLIRALLPPRLRIPFSVLWIADGKEPPTPKFISRREQV